MPRRLFTWKIRTRELALGDRTLVMGVLNVTPDSFSDGGNYLDPDRAYARAMEMEEQGADIIDIGAESTKPGAQQVTASEELHRLVPVLKRLRDKLSIPISVDTYKAEVAERALELGVEIINDPSGFTFDPLLSKPLVQYDAGVILNHMRGRPETWASLGPMPDVMGNIIKDLDASVSRARRAGVDRMRIVVDPGIGFGKRREQNSEILARLEEMTRLELPILVGPSRKSFLAQPEERETEFATAAAVAAAVLAGAHLVRVHDVKAMKVVVTVADEIWRATQKLAEAREAPAVDAPARRSRPQVQTPEIEATAVRPPVRPPLIRNFNPAVKREERTPDQESPAMELREERAEPPAYKQPVPPEFEQRPSAEASARPVRSQDSRPPRPAGDRPRFEGSRPPRPDGDRPRFEGSRPPRPDGNRPRFEGSRPPRPGGDRPRFEGSRPPRPGGDRPRFEGSRPPRPEGDRPRFEGSRPPRPVGDRPRFEGSRPPRPGGDRPRFEGSRPPRPGGDRPRFEGSRPPRPGGDRPRFEGSRPPRPEGDRPRFEGSRPPRPEGDRPRFEGSRPPRPEGDRPRFEGSRPPRPSGDRPASDGARPPRPAGGRPSFGGSRPPRPGGGRPSFGNSRPGGMRPGSRSSGSRPGGPKRPGAGGKDHRKGPPRDSKP